MLKLFDCVCSTSQRSRRAAQQLRSMSRCCKVLALRLVCSVASCCTMLEWALLQPAKNHPQPQSPDSPSYQPSAHPPLVHPPPVPTPACHRQHLRASRHPARLVTPTPRTTVHPAGCRTRPRIVPAAAASVPLPPHQLFPIPPLSPPEPHPPHLAASSRWALAWAQVPHRPRARPQLQAQPQPATQPGSARLPQHKLRASITQLWVATK